MRFSFRAGLAVLAALIATVGFAAPPASPIESTASGDPRDYGRPSVRVFTSKDGIPQNAITAMATDNNGQLWIGTKDGAASYDGREWRVLNIPPEAGRNGIGFIVQGANGDMWFALLGGGVVRRSQHGDMTVYSAPWGVPDAYVHGLYEMSEPGRPNTIVCVGSRSLVRFIDGKWVEDPEFPRQFSGDCNFVSVVRGYQGADELWCSVSNGDTLRLRNGVWTTYPSAMAGGHSVTTYRVVLTDALDGTPHVIAGRTDGVALFDGSAWVPFPGMPSEMRLENVFALCDTRAPDGSTALWAADIAGPMYRYADGRWARALTQTRAHDVGIWSMMTTGDLHATDALWIGTAGAGLVRLHLGLWTAFDKSIGLVTESTYSILATSHPTDGDVVWIGAINGGLVRFARGKARQVLRSDGTWIPWPMCLADDPSATRERVIVGEAGALNIVEDGVAIRTFRKKDGVSGFDVTCLLKTADEAGESVFWVGGDAGVCKLVGDRLEPGPAMPPNAVTCLAETVAPSGGRTLWVGTERGLLVFAPDGQREIDMSSGLPAKNVLSLKEVTLKTGVHELWVGTRLGIARIALDGTFRVTGTLSTNSVPALPNNTIYRIEFDNAGRIYLPTNRGVARLTERPPTARRTREFDVTTFTTDDGLPNDECNTGASTVDHRGRIWVGTLNGIAMYDPRAEIVPAPSRLIFVRRSLVDDGDVALEDDAQLAYNRNHLTFEYALLSYNRESTIVYRTQLVGYEDEPSDWTHDAKREFNSLPTGSFVFRVWSRDAAGVDVGPIEVSFAVRPPPWFTWWAFVLYALAILALGYLAIRWRLRAFAQRNVQLQEAIAARTIELADTVRELQVSQQTAMASERDAQAANLAKSVFLANMSHELRTPLNAVLGFAQLLDRTGSLGTNERHQVGIIRRSGEHLLGLINDVLSLAKIEAGKLELHEQPFSPIELLAAVESMTRVRADAKDLSLTFDVAAGFPPVVFGDDGKLRQVLLNLLGNAVKFTDTGGVRLSADWRDDRATFEVSDDGRGIAEDEFGGLFHAFSQTASGRATTEGTGLGLAISQQIVQLMGGEISVSSTPGTGSTFRFEIPLPESSEHALESSRRTIVKVRDDERRRRVLVVDDSAENRHLLVVLLTSVGFDVREARDGREALDISESWRPRVIFMDRRMPVMDGTEATRRIRERERLNGGAGHRVVIIATTASVFEQERDEIIAGGCDDLVIKPFDESEIFTMLERHAHVRFAFAGDGAPRGADSDTQGAVIARMKTLDPLVARRLYDALNVGDAVLAGDVALEIETIDPELGREIARQIREFKMDRLMVVLEGSVT